ncbi:hypothetical protein [Flectobacillus roseus]|uniref:Uncharacterized protein n=1 Tax=Flectobacillus roseus TaxID=502259 RepID=A0ABT6Y705_9BACT|nr:hypothetical protein [Flectobacillus roseus]MDI9859353.1 hypothetical protein [Flectobacillus roseus]
MYILPRVVLFCAIFSCIAGIAAAQDVSINILNQPAAVAKGSSTGRVIIDICNNDGGIRTAAANKLRPLISLPSSLVGSSIVPVNIVGWTVLSNDGSNIRLENTLPIAPATCSQIEIGYTGVNVGGPLTITGTLGFNGPQTTGNLSGNDNSTTSLTVFLDTDNDGVGDSIDLDDDNDGILDTVENAQANVDTDGDGVPNRIDLDSDNDGINDVIEGGGIDIDFDGIADGIIGGTGIPASAGAGLLLSDTDLDTRKNPYDLDSDNDGINDIIESGNAALIDANGDGIVDGTDSDLDGIMGSADGSANWGDTSDPVPLNSDSATGADYLDLDSDNDGISDLLESGISNPATLDINGDGKIDSILDLDADGIIASVDGSTSYGDANSPTPPDLNSSGTPDYRESNPDMDGDGVSNSQEITDGTNYTDGCSYNATNQILANTSTLWRTADCDGDGVNNYKELTGTDNNALTPLDNTNPKDGCSYNSVDQVYASTTLAWKALDCDGDGLTNKEEIDPNNDGIPDLTTTDPKNPDTDGDTYNDKIDTCPLVAGIAPSGCPLDTDKDGLADVTDLDDDNDGILDTVENAQLSADTDGDGTPNRIDLDSDNDGIRDVAETLGIDLNEDGMVDGPVNLQGVPLAAAAGLGLTPPDTDLDGKPNPYDVDSDNNGISDLLEAGLNPNWDLDEDGKIDCTGNCDTDGDGVPNVSDGSSSDWKDAPIPDLTPTTEINSLEFTSVSNARDIVVNVFEKNNVQNVSGNITGFRITKISGFDITYSINTGTSNVLGGSTNSNSDWTFSENTNFITVTAKPGVSIPQNSFKKIGFTVTRKGGIPSNTSQNITVTILYGSGGEGRVDNNIVETKITAN